MCDGGDLIDAEVLRPRVGIDADFFDLRTDIIFEDGFSRRCGEIIQERLSGLGKNGTHRFIIERRIRSRAA